MFVKQNRVIDIGRHDIMTCVLCIHEVKYAVNGLSERARIEMETEQIDTRNTFWTIGRDHATSIIAERRIAKSRKQRCRRIYWRAFGTLE